MSEDEPSAFEELTRENLREQLERQDYVIDDDLLITVLLAIRMGKPLLLEGQPGSGKTELGKVLANGSDTKFIRLQCYEGLAAENALYEWNYGKQLLSIQAEGGTVSEHDGSSTVFSREYLEERPLLQALTHEGEYPPVLLIDEIDRADEEFEALLLEILSDYQVSIPEYGTIQAENRPVVVITSNRTRHLSDALKRRCLYFHMESPSFEKEFEIVRRKVPQLHTAVAAEVCGIIETLREEPLLKPPGVAEALDWARALEELRTQDETDNISEEELRQTIGTFLKEVEDVQKIDDELLEELISVGEKTRQTYNEETNG